MTEHNEALGLEQKCKGPGLWLIEGYEVQRAYPHVWEVRSIGSRHIVHVARTLRGCRDWIADIRFA